MSIFVALIAGRPIFVAPLPVSLAVLLSSSKQPRVAINPAAMYLCMLIHAPYQPYRYVPLCTAVCRLMNPVPPLFLCACSWSRTSKGRTQSWRKCCGCHSNSSLRASKAWRQPTELPLRTLRGTAAVAAAAKGRQRARRCPRARWMRSRRRNTAGGLASMTGRCV